MQLILFPTSGKLRYLDFIKTVEYPVETKTFYNLLKTQDKKYFKDSPNKNIHIWGTTDGSNKSFKNIWRKTNVNDHCYFYREKKYFSKGIIKHKLINEDIAIKLWGKGRKGEIWKNLYVIENLQNISITNIELGRLISSEQIKILTAVKILKLTDDEEKNLNYLNDFPNQDNLTKLYQEKLKNLEKLTDVSAQSKRRLEQALLSEFLFSKTSSSECAICQKTFPNEILVTGHIKKRSLANEKERRDINIVMPICKLGCDELFELGYIYVDNNGVIKCNDKKKITVDMSGYLSKLNNKKCSIYSKGNSKYFKFHKKLHTT